MRCLSLFCRGIRRSDVGKELRKMDSVGGDSAKVYCCSNTARSEAKKLALFDVVLSVLGLIFASWLTEVVRHHGEYFRNITEGTNTTLHDLAFLSDLSSSESNVWLGSFLVWEGWGIVLGGTLFYAALKNLVGLLRVWLVLGGVFVLIVEFAAVVALEVVTEKKVVVGVNGTVLVLYRAYEVFIVVKLLGELGAPIAGGGEDGVFCCCFQRVNSASSTAANNPTIHVDKCASSGGASASAAGGGDEITPIGGGAGGGGVIVGVNKDECD